MYYYIDLCCCCLKKPSPLNVYLFKNESEGTNNVNYIEQIQAICEDLQLVRNLPFQLCYNCQRLMQEATKLKQYLIRQEENEGCSKLLVKDLTCSACLEKCAILVDQPSESNVLGVSYKSYTHLLREIFQYFIFESHVSYKYCKRCIKYIGSAYSLKTLIGANNSLYEKYCSMLTNTSSSKHINYSQLLILLDRKLADSANTFFVKIRITEESIAEDDSIFVELERDADYQSDETNHETIASKRKRNKCVYCGKTFNLKYRLKVHERIHTDDKPYRCTVCEISFARLDLLRNHIKTHSAEKPHKCAYCEMSFHRKYKVIEHERVHTGEKPHKCNQCQKFFRRKRNLDQHERIHTGEKPYNCAYCQMPFRLKEHLRVHERIHTGVKPFICNVCDATFTRKSSLKYHGKLHGLPCFF